MKLLFAYTGKAIAQAGLTLPNSVLSYQQLGTSPFIFYQQVASGLQLAGDELQANIGYVNISARGFDIVSKLAAGEVLTWGYRYRGTYNTNSTSVLGGLVNNSPRVFYSPLRWSDVGSNNTTYPDLYIEHTLDPVEGTLTGFINGKKIRSVPIPDRSVLADVNLSFLSPFNGGSSNKWFTHFYAGVFNKTEEFTRLVSWECESLGEVANDLKDGDGVLNRNTVTDTWKSVTYALPSKPYEAVSFDLTARNPQAASTLLTDLSDGTTTSLYTFQDIGPIQVDTEFGNKTSGKSLPGIVPSKQATQLTIKLKAALKQE